MVLHLDIITGLFFSFVIFTVFSLCLSVRCTKNPGLCSSLHVGGESCQHQLRDPGSPQWCVYHVAARWTPAAQRQLYQRQNLYHPHWKLPAGKRPITTWTSCSFAHKHLINALISSGDVFSLRWCCRLIIEQRKHIVRCKYREWNSWLGTLRLMHALLIHRRLTRTPRTTLAATTAQLLMRLGQSPKSSSWFRLVRLFSVTWPLHRTFVFYPRGV